MQVFLMPNLEKENAPYCIWRAADVLSTNGAQVLVEEKYAALCGGAPVTVCTLQEALAHCDVLIAIGGDGTMLRCASYAVRNNKPLLGINAGRLGFMTGVEADALDSLARLVTGNYRTDRRMLLDCIRHTKDGEEHYLALNEAVISNAGISRMIEVELYTSESDPISYRADGLILFTPTGSTAYALSAGGPLIEPNVNCIGVTAICPHSLTARPVLFAPDKVLFVRAADANRSPVYLTVDGDQGTMLDPGDFIEVRQSEQVLQLISLSDSGFYETLRRKFKI